jgi:tRNA-dihydrouridine synthase
MSKEGIFLTHQRISRLPMMIYLAPLQGITDRIYRNLFPVYFKGVDRAVAPFISPLKKMTPDSRHLREVYPAENRGIPTIPQIMSSNPDDFTTLANILYDRGCGTVNWNLGCPFPMVVKKGRGAGMLRYPERVASFLEKTLPAIKPALSIKLRIGLAYPDEVFELLPIFNRFPLDELIIHPRTGVQMYEGEVDLDVFAECLTLSQHRVVYNGDIDSPEKMATLSKRFGSVERWMIGRGLLRNPFLAEEIKWNTEKSYSEKVKIIRAFHDHLFAEYSKVLCGPSHITNKMKEIWTYLGDFFETGAKIKKRIHKLHHRDNYVDVVNKVFDEQI